jgi:hypothetical protein
MVLEYTKAASILGLETLTFKSESGVLGVEIKRNNDLTDSYCSDICPTSEDFIVTIKLERLKVVKNGFVVNVLKGGKALHFFNDDRTEQYIIASEVRK